MRNLFVCLLIVFTATAYTAQSDLPDWVLPELTKYPVDTFLFGVGMEPGSGEEVFAVAVNKARREVAENILENVRFVIRSNKEALQYDIVLEHYNPVIESSDALQLKGLSVRNLTVDLARTEPNMYAFAYVKRADLKNLYVKRASELREEIRQTLDSAQVAEKAYNIKGAVKKYLSTYPLYEALKEAELIQLGTAYTLNLNDSFTELVGAAMGTTGDSLMSHRKVIHRVEKLQQEPITSLEDITRVVASQLSQQTGSLGSKVLIEPFTYEDSGMTCQSSRALLNALQQQLGWSTADRMRGFMKKNQVELLQLAGSYWENGDEITIRATLRNINTGDFLASAVVRFFQSQLRDSISFQPPNYERILPEKEAFDPRNHVPSYEDPEDSTSESAVPHKVFSSGELKVETWTNKGSGPVYYTEGETMMVFGRVNQPAYLRLLYILADGKRVLLQDNYHIDLPDVNSDVKIGEFECIPPFGTELLIVTARTEEFPPIETYQEADYHFLVDQDPGSAARKFRGMKPKTSNDDQQQPPGFQQSDAQLVLTTIEK
jgi:hypothetical protein